jgi:uncharacterized protein YwbE
LAEDLESRDRVRCVLLGHGLKGVSFLLRRDVKTGQLDRGVVGDSNKMSLTGWVVLYIRIRDGLNSLKSVVFSIQ